MPAAKRSCGFREEALEVADCLTVGMAIPVREQEEFGLEDAGQPGWPGAG